MVEGAENGDHAVGDGLALVQRVSYGRCSRFHGRHCLRNPHFFNFSFSRRIFSLCLAGEKIKSEIAKFVWRNLITDQRGLRKSFIKRIVLVDGYSV